MTAPENLNKDFKIVSRILFESEIGELQDFEPWLKETMFPYKFVKSFVSGKDVIISSPHYTKDARFISQDEIGSVKFGPLNVNEITDIDSLLEAVEDRIIYCGNKTFGKNQNAEKVDNCTDCWDVYDSHNIYKVKYAAYSSCNRDSEHIYGVSAFPKSAYSIRCLEGVGATRCFETYYATNVMDTYYCLNVSGCSNCMFSFNQKAKHDMIGNLQLSKERYAEIRKKLLSEIAEKLKKDKRIFSIAEIVKGGKRIKDVQIEPSPVPATVENAFANTTRVVLGREYNKSEKLAPWLLKKVIDVKRVNAAFGKPTYWVDLPVLKNLAPERLLATEEAFKSSEMGIAIKDGEMPSLDEILKRVAEKAYFTFEFIDGNSLNVVDTPDIFNATNSYRCWDVTESMYAGYSSGVVRNSKYVFGGYLRILSSQFCINCYDVSNVSSCLEAESSHSCSGAYFCHNCENVQDGIFCFNAKGLRYAIGNQEVGREEFLRVKKVLLDYINSELEKKGKLDFDIFTIGARNKRQ